jgi:hypothetical protein
MFDLEDNSNAYQLDAHSQPMSEEEFDKRIETVLSSLILESNCVTDKDYQNHTKAVLEAYMDNIDSNGNVPFLEDITMNVVEENWEKALDIGYLDYYYGKNNCGYRSFLTYEEDKEDSDYISDLADIWYQDYVQMNGDDLVEYIVRILDDNHMCYQDADNEISSVSSMLRKRIYFNDCQNLLLKDWHLLTLEALGAKSEYELKKLLSCNIVSSE